MSESARSIKVLDDPQRFPSSPRKDRQWILSSLLTERTECLSGRRLNLDELHGPEFYSASTAESRVALKAATLRTGYCNFMAQYSSPMAVPRRKLEASLPHSPHCRCSIATSLAYANWPKAHVAKTVTYFNLNRKYRL